MHSPSVFALFAVITAVAAGSVTVPRLHVRTPSYGYSFPQSQLMRSGIPITHHPTPTYFNTHPDPPNWPHESHKELLTEAIERIVEAGRLRPDDVVRQVFYKPRPWSKPVPPTMPVNEILDNIVSQMEMPKKPAKNIQPEPSFVMEPDENKAELTTPDQPISVLPMESRPDAATVRSEEPPIEIEVLPLPSTAPAEPAEEPIPNPVDAISQIIREEAAKDPAPTKSSGTVLLDMIARLSESLGQLVGVIDQAVDKGTFSESMVNQIDQIIPDALVDVERIASKVGQLDK